MSQTVQVRLKCDRVVGFGTIQYEGDVIDVAPDEATRLVRAGQAEPVTTQRVQTATLDRSANTRAGRREPKSSSPKG